MTGSEDILLERFMSLNEDRASVTPEQFLQSLSMELSPEELVSLRQNLESLWLTIQVGNRLKSPEDELLPSQSGWSTSFERIVYIKSFYGTG